MKNSIKEQIQDIHASEKIALGKWDFISHVLKIETQGYIQRQ